MKDLSAKMCVVCGKHAMMHNNRPRSLHKTKRVVFANLIKHKVEGDPRTMYICARCRRTERQQVAA